MSERPFDGDVEALVTDRYLESLLLAADQRAAAPLRAAHDDPADLPDPILRRTARRLSDELVRVHPSFRFEERLATTLAAAAQAMRTDVAPVPGLDLPAVIPFAPEAPVFGSEIPVFGSETPAFAPQTSPSAPLGSAFASAAITSAALSIAGAAVVALAWRLGYLPRRPLRAAPQEARA